MTIAYLILAHKNIKQVALLINLLVGDTDNYCFIHLDKHLNINLIFKQLKANVKTKNWQFIKKRNYINWGGFSMVEATLQLILEACNFRDKKFSCLSLHSGMDLPIKCPDEIFDYLIPHEKKQFMEYFELPNHLNWAGDGGLDRVNYYWFVDELGYQETEKLVTAQKLNSIKRNWPNIDKIYGGSQWWTLTIDCAMYIINFLNKTPEFYRFFKYSNTSDELFFQTILLNSPYKDQIENNNLRMIDWNVNSRSPKTLDMTDLEELKCSDKLYARKFDENTDKEIIKYFVEKINS